MNISIKIITFLVCTCILFACHSTGINVRKTEKPIQINQNNPYSDYWTALYCGMPELSDPHISYSEQEQLKEAFMLIKSGRLNSAEPILRKLNNSKNDTIATAGKKLLSTILFYNSKWAECDTLNKISNFRRKKKIYPIYLDYIPLQREKYYIPDKPDTIKIQIKKGLPIIELKVNGFKYNFLIDTGCDITCVSNSFATALNLKSLGSHSSGVINSIGDSFDIISSSLDSLNIMNITAYNHPVIITSNENLTFEFMNYAFLEFNGIIGWNFLKNLDFTIDYKKELLIIRKPKIRENLPQNMFWLGTPIFKLYTSDGIETNFAFDTGDQVSNFFNLLIQKVKPKNIQSDLRRAYGVGGSKIVEVKRIEQLNLYLPPNYEIQFSNIESGVELSSLILCLDGRLGSDFLFYSRIRIDALNNNFEYFHYSTSD